MLDCRGKLLRAGDLVAVAAGRQVIGTLVHDPDDIRYVRLHVQINPEKKRYFGASSRRILNITALIQEELDKPVVRVLH